MCHHLGLNLSLAELRDLQWDRLSRMQNFVFREIARFKRFDGKMSPGADGVGHSLDEHAIAETFDLHLVGISVIVDFTFHTQQLTIFPYFDAT